jgi:serine protease inhibitor
MAELQQINDGYRGLLGLESGLDPSTTFDIANSVWYRQNFVFHQAFITRVQQVFDAQVSPGAFDESTKNAVNSWVSQQTNGKIPTILDAIAAENVMFLINAIYFKGSWREQFDPAKTTPQPFQAVGGTQTVSMMVRPEKTGKIRFGYTAQATIGELSYGNGAFVMTVLLPNDPAGIASLAASLDTASFSALVASMQERDFRVELPKFSLAYERTLNDDLKALGMVDPFSEMNADFSGMSPSQLFISFVKHKTFVEVNEEGTEAAAVTNTGVNVTSLPPCLCVNRPFIFVIRERFSGTILFIGRMLRIPA